MHYCSQQQDYLFGLRILHRLYYTQTLPSGSCITAHHTLPKTSKIELINIYLMLNLPSIIRDFVNLMNNVHSVETSGSFPLLVDRRGQKVKSNLGVQYLNKYTTKVSLCYSMSSEATKLLKSEEYLMLTEQLWFREPESESQQSSRAYSPCSRGPNDSRESQHRVLNISYLHRRW